MEMPHNAFKRAIRDGKSQIGLWSSLSSNYTVEVIAGAGFDWILLDTEHSPNDLESVLQQAQAAAAYPVSTVARVPWNDMVTIKRFLDIGIQTLLIPYVCSVAGGEGCRAPTRAIRRPACAASRARRARPASGASRTTRSMRRRRSACSCRSRRRARSTSSKTSARSTASTACSSARPTSTRRWATPARVNNPAVVPMIEEAMRRIRKCGKAPGVLAFAEPDIRRYIAAGALFTAVGSDGGILARGAEALAAKYKG